MTPRSNSSLPTQSTTAFINAYYQHAPPKGSKGGYLTYKGSGLPYVAGNGDMRICLNNAIKVKSCPLRAAAYHTPAFTCITSHFQQ